MSVPVPSSNGVSVFSVDTLIKYMGNDDNARAVVAKIVRDACAPGKAPFVQAAAALREQRLADAGRIFHSLRGSVGTLGAQRLVQASMALEVAIAEQRGADIPSLFNALEYEYEQVLEQAGVWLTLDAPAGGKSA